jgi:8-oxo-dGTP diphosphatase
MEETGHDVSVHEYLGTLVYETGGGSKVVHYWRMEAGHMPVRQLMRDVKAVDWLPLGSAVERLSRGYEQAFLEHVGPIALAAASGVEGVALPKAAQPVAHEYKIGRSRFFQSLLRLIRFRSCPGRDPAPSARSRASSSRYGDA